MHEKPYASFYDLFSGSGGVSLRFYAAIEHIDGVSDETLERIKAIRAGWAGAPDKARKKMLAEALEKIFSDLDQLDEDGQ